MNNSWFFRNEHPQCCAGNDNFETRTSKEQVKKNLFFTFFS